MVGVMAWGPASAVGALIDGTLITVMAKTMARVACLVVAGVGGRKGNLGMSSSPPGLDSLEDSFLVGYQGGGGGRDVGGGRGAGGKGGDEGGGGVRRITAGEFQHVSVYVFQKFKHAELIHRHYQRSFDLKINLSYEAEEDSLLWGWGDVGGHKSEVRVLEICASKGI